MKGFIIRKRSMVVVMVWRLQWVVMVAIKRIHSLVYPLIHLLNHPFIHTTTHPPIREYSRSLPVTHDGSIEAHDKCGAVEEHVEAIGYKAQTVGQYSVRQFYEGERL